MADENQIPPPGYCDYTLVDWTTEATRSKTAPDESGSILLRPQLSKYPLVFDRHLANHHGRGIHVILIDGTLLWDRDARWLKAFAAQHPEVRIPQPD